MVRRRFWLERLQDAWAKKRVVWLSGVRRAGKTVLVQSLAGVEYFDCERPRVRRLLADAEAFLDSIRGKRIVLDEVHRLDNPSELLKLAADHYPDVHVLATGSSTLGASRKFRDTLTGRKREVWLTPMTLADLEDFHASDLRRRFLRGGLPPFFLPDELPEVEFQDWMDAYWAKDIQELFRLERRASFLRFFELLTMQSGGVFEATRFARECEVSRPTIVNYLAALEATFVVHVVRPFSSRRQHEIVAAPKVYGFDTGFVCYHRGWHALRREDMGLLWEHFVLNELHANLQTRRVHYWRRKGGREVDFVLVRRGRPPVAIECKWSTADPDWKGLEAFAADYPKASCYIVAPDCARPTERRSGKVTATVLGLPDLIRRLGEA